MFVADEIVQEPGYLNLEQSKEVLAVLESTDMSFDEIAVIANAIVKAVSDQTIAAELKKYREVYKHETEWIAGKESAEATAARSRATKMVWTVLNDTIAHHPELNQARVVRGLAALEYVQEAELTSRAV